MAHQMVYTSIKSGLVAGRSGFCTAARHREISDALVGRIEDLSGQYDRGSLATRQGGSLPVIYSHRVVAIRGREWHLLMRIADAGTDYSGRTNHIAHTFVLEPSEVAGLRLTPAEIILQLIRGKQWIERYTDAARYFDPEEGPDLRSFAPLANLPARRWQSETGAAANAALLMDSQAAMGVGIVIPESNDPDLLLTLFAESQLIACPDRSKSVSLWTRSFTTLMQSSEQRGDFDWYGCALNSPVHLQMLKANRFLVELGSGLASPKGRFADIAEGKQVAEEVSAVRSRVESVAETAPSPVGGTDPTVPDLVVPAASLRPAGELLGTGRGREKRKTGLPVWVPVVGGIAVLGMVAVIAMMLFGTSASEKFARNIEELLRNGEWAEAGALLNDMEEAEKRDYRENPKFKALEDTYKVARNYDWISRNVSGTAPDGSPITDIVGFKGSVDGVEKGLKESKLPGVGVEPFLVVEDLKKGASDYVASYQGLLASLQQDWDSLKGGKANGLNFEKLGQVDRERFRDQIEDLEAAKKIVGDFVKFREKEHEDIEDAKKVRDEMADRVNQRVAEADGKSWIAALSGINLMIGAFEPKQKVTSLPTEETDTGTTETEMPVESEAGEAPQLPITYFWRVNDGNTYSYQGIPELVGEFPAKPYLTAKISFDWDELSQIRTEGLFVNLNIYSEKEAQAPVFNVSSGHTLEPTSSFPDRYRAGYFLALGDKPGGEPLVQVVAQSASSSLVDAVTKPFLLHFPIDRALTKEGGKVVVSSELLEILAQLRFPSKEPTFHLVWVGSSGVDASWSVKSLSRLEGELLRGMGQEIERRKAEIKRYGEKKNIDKRFSEIFENLGKDLFCHIDGSRPIYKLEVEEISGGKNQNNLVYRQKVVFDKNADGLALIETLTEYTPKSSGRIPLIDYVNDHVFRVFSEWGGHKGASNFAEGEKFLNESLNVNLAPESALESWLKVAEMSKTSGWAKPPDTSNEKDGKVANDRRRAYPHARFRADFFRKWERIFTPENVAIAKDKILGGAFREEELKRMEFELKEKEKELDEIGEKSLPELGDFYLVVEDKGAFFRVVAIR